jgi:hypothetical protein
MSARPSLPSRRTLLKRVAAFMAVPAAFGTSLVFATSAGAQTRVDQKFFGLHIHKLDVPYPDGGRTQWPFLQFGSWRIWNSYTAWLDLQPTATSWDFSRLDLYLNLAEKAKVDVLLTLGRTPTWASARPLEKRGNMPGSTAEPTNISDWENYVTTVVKRYRGRIGAYEIWNEPAFSEVDPIYRKDGTVIQFFSGSAEAMVKLSESAYKAIKAQDKTAMVVSPSVTSEGNGLRRLETFLRAGGGAWIDVVGFHFYAAPPEATYQIALDLKKLLAKYGLTSKPIWNTEMGYAYARPDLGVTAAPHASRWLDVIDTSKGAAYLARAHILMAAAGVSRLYWFNWDAETPFPTMGIAASRGAGRTPMTDAYEKVEKWLVGSTIGECVVNGTVWTCPIKLNNGRQGLLIWSTDAGGPTDASKYLDAKKADRLLAHDLEPISDSRHVTISEMPTLLME